MQNQENTSRRRFLKGAGALLALPFMESLFPSRVLGAGKTATPPMRMGIFTVTGGTVIESFTNRVPGPLTKLPSILQPLEFAKDDLLILTGLGQCGRYNDGDVGGHGALAWSHLTGAEYIREEGQRVTSSISIDQKVAEVTGEHTYLPSLEMGLDVHHPVMYSFRNADTAVPYESDPRMIFDRMFRGRKPIVPNWQRRATKIATDVQKTATRDSHDRSVVDLVLSDANDLKRNLGRDDLHKLDQYLDSVRSVERRIRIREAVLREDLLDAELPGPSKLHIPGEFAPAGTSKEKISRMVHIDPERHEEYIQIMSDLAVLAFQTDTTRVVTLALGTDDAEFPGVVTVGYERHCHILEHRGNHDRHELIEPIAREGLRQIHTWYTSLFAEMIRKMKAIDEGGSSLLDNSMILYTSYMAHGGHGTQNFPVALVGNAQGKLKPGRQIDYQKRTPMANLYVEMLDRMGIPVESFGESKTSRSAKYNGRLPDLS